jgi:lipopolysaccharide export LptBFGC system permease protein LptF
MGTLSRYLLRRHLAPFALALAALTSMMLFNQMAKRLPALLDQGVPGRIIVEVFILSVPFILAMTVPMAVLIAVLRVFTRLASDRQIPTVQAGGVSALRLITPVLGGAACLATLTFLCNDQILPRSNHRLREILIDIQHQRAVFTTRQLDKSDREMSISEMQAAGRSARAEADTAEITGRQSVAEAARQRAASYQVEIQKKYAMAAACLVLVLFGAPVALRFQSSGVGLVIGMSVAVFVVLYIGLIGGEDLGDRLMVSPFVAMWTTNIIFASIGLLVLSRTPRVGYAEPRQGDVTTAGRGEEVAPGNYLTRLWRGQIPLGMTYWVWGVLLNAFMRNLLIQGATTPYRVTYFVYYAFTMVAIWRSAGRYQGQRIWTTLARVSVILGVVFTLLALFNAGVLDLIATRT